jgi:hypothetical protein
VISTVVWESCASITASDDFNVLATGDVTFRAGAPVMLGNGFSVASGGTFAVEITSP